MAMISVLVLLGLGLVTATVLAVASRVFHVEEDPRVQAVLEALPGANCGGCGYAGCEGYATAVATDPAVPANRCCAGGAETSIAVGELTGKTVAASIRWCRSASCGQGGATWPCAAIIRVCLRVRRPPVCGRVRDSCSYSCLGFGDCVQVCPFDAIEVRGGLARVNASKCTGCGKCAETCPRNVLELVPGSRPGDGLLFHQGQAQGRDGSLQGRLHQVRALRQELSRRCGHAGERPHPHQS